MPKLTATATRPDGVTIEADIAQLRINIDKEQATVVLMVPSKTGYLEKRVSTGSRQDLAAALPLAGLAGGIKALASALLQAEIDACSEEQPSE